jgi:hypothetical protein
MAKIIIHTDGPVEAAGLIVSTVAEQIDAGYTKGGVYGGSGIYWETEED